MKLEYKEGKKSKVGEGERSRRNKRILERLEKM